ATLEKAFSSVYSQRGVPPRILLNRGDTFVWPTNSSVPAPAILDAYGSGALPLITMAAGQDIYREEGSGGGGTGWGYSVYFNDFYVQWPSRSTQQVALRIRGSQLIGSIVQNGSVTVSSGYARILLMNTIVAGANTAGFFGSGDWDSLINCALYGNGD